MIKSLLQRIQQQLGSTETTPAAEAARHDAIRIATAGLLLEVAHADDELHGDEEEHLLEHLRGEYGLDESTITELMTEADYARKATIDHWGFANLLRTKTTLEQRVEVVKTMWRIVYADGRLTQNEEYLLRKLAGLLGLEHHIMIEAKVAVRRQLGIV